MGTGPNVTVTDYNARFNKLEGTNTTRDLERMLNKAKLDNSDVKISGNNE